MNTTTRLLKLCEEKKCCPLGLAMRGSYPAPKRAARALQLFELDAEDIASQWDLYLESRTNTEPCMTASRIMRTLLHLGGFCRPPKSLTRCERRWINA